MFNKFDQSMYKKKKVAQKKHRKNQGKKISSLRFR